MTDSRDERRSSEPDDRPPASPVDEEPGDAFRSDDPPAEADAPPDGRDRNEGGFGQGDAGDAPTTPHGSTRTTAESPDESKARRPTERMESPAGPSRGDPDPTRGPPQNGGRSPDESSRSGLLQYVFDIGSSVFIVVAVGGLLFAASGVWPPLVAIESGSMEPHIQKGDLVFVMEEQRFPGPGAQSDSGVVTAHMGSETGYRMFEEYGDVIVYQPGGSERRTPIIHRAMLWVEDGENWYDRADPEAVGNADNCEALRHCPAPHAGFITKGDNTVTNERYDQVRGLSGPVKPEWVMGTAEVRVPLLGEVRLLTGQASANATASDRLPPGATAAGA